jgi:tRNA1(Val) A37 N6-methylase TrmN6
MVQSVHCKCKIIADFSAGYGELLEAAKKKWKSAKPVAIDINKRIINVLRTKHQDWEIGRVNFLSSKSRNKASILNKIKGKVSLVLLNPPFSCRGGTRYEAKLNGFSVKCSLALAFIMSALEYLAPKGEIIALLPLGTLRSLKDKDAWNQLSKLFIKRIIAENGKNTFYNCFPKTVIVHLIRRRKPINCKPKLECHFNSNGIEVKIVRGTFSMHELPKEERTNCKHKLLIHSTNLRNGIVEIGDLKANKGRKFRGPGVLLPRVGLPNINKICIVQNSTSFILSDCVIGLKCKNKRIALFVKKSLQQNWNIIEKCYGGTCSRYITVSSLINLLSTLGFQSKIAR